MVMRMPIVTICHSDNNRPQGLQILKPGDDGGLAAGRAAAATTSSCGEGGGATLFLDEARSTLVATCENGQVNGGRFRLR